MNRRSGGFHRWLAETDFWWVMPTVLALAAVVLTVMDAIDPYTSDYHMWALGCVTAMLIIAISRGSRL